MQDPECFWCHRKLSEHKSTFCEPCGHAHLRCSEVPQTGAYEDMIHKRGAYAPKKLKMMEGGCNCEERVRR